MKKVFLRILMSISVLFHAGGSLAGGSELDAFKKEIRAKYDMKEQAFANNDPAPILNQFYSSDIISTDLEGNTHIGTEGIRPIYDAIIGGSAKVESIHTHVNGNMGWDWTNFTATPPDPKSQPFTFKILFVWEKIAGEWWCRNEAMAFGQFDKDKN